MPLRIIAMLLFAFATGLSGCSGSRESRSAVGTPLASANNQMATSTPVPATAAGTPVTQSNDSGKSKFDACSLLTSAEIKAVQGEALKETKASGGPQGGFLVSQCFFSLPTFNNSISLTVTQKGEGPNARNPKDLWNSTFHGPKERERGREGGEEGERSPEPKQVGGLADEALWLGNRVGGALYVLKGNSFIRISIGGPASQDTKISKTKSLAQKVIRHL